MPPGEAGELYVKGPGMMHGYWRMPEETASVLSEDGWLRTGNIRTMSDRGMIGFVDRKKDIVVVSGLKAYPNGIEGGVMMHPGVNEVGAVGVPDERSGEVVQAYAVKKDPALTVHVVITQNRTNLAAYKVPRQVEFRDALPKSPIGKIRRRKLWEKPASVGGV